MNCKIEYEEKGKNVKRGNLIGMEWNGWMNCKFRYGMVWSEERKREKVL